MFKGSFILTEFGKIGKLANLAGQLGKFASSPRVPKTNCQCNRLNSK